MATHSCIGLFVLAVSPFVVPYLYPDDAFWEQPDMEPSIYDLKKGWILTSINWWDDGERAYIEKRTRNLTASRLWHKLRRKYLSAVHFGDICNWKKNKSTAKLIRKILYFDLNKEKVPETTSIKRSIFPELIRKGHMVRECGMFIDVFDPFMIASPEGLISNDTAVVVKWFRTPEFGQRTINDLMWTNDNDVFGFFEKRYGERTSYINTTHNYFYEMQGILHVTKLLHGLLVFVGPVDYLICPTIHKENWFFEQKMIKRLRFFYMKCLLPELIDGRYKRKLNIRKIRMQE